MLLWRTPPYSVDKLPTDPNSSPPALFLVKMILNVAASTSCRIEIIDPPARLPGDMIAAACFAVKLRGELSEAKCTSSKPPPKLCIPSSSGFCGRYLQPECSTAPAPTPGMLTGHNQNYSEENEVSVASALLNFDLVVLLSLGDLTLVSHEFNFDVRLDIYCTQPGARLLVNKMTLTGAVPAGRRLAVAEGGREGAQLLHR